MSEWRETNLGELVSFMSKGIPPKYAEEQTETTIKVLNQKCNKEFKINYDVARLHDTEKKKVGQEKYLKNGDILINSTGLGSAGRVAQLLEVPEPTIVDGHMIILRNNEFIEPVYLGYSLKNSQLFIEQLQEGSTGQTELNRQRLLDEVLVSFPTSLDEQKAIADTLASLDNTIESNNEVSQVLEEIAQTLFKSWFVDFEPFGGEMPEDWEVGNMSDVANFNKNSYSSKENWDFINYLDTSSITKGIISEIQCLNTLEDKIPSRAKRKVFSGDVIYSTVRPNQLHYGFIAEPEENMLVSTGFSVITALEHRSFERIFLYLSQPEITEKLQQLGEQSTSTYPAIKSDDIGALTYMIPPVSIEKDFKDLVSPMFSVIANNQQENQTLTQIRNTLLPKLMSGEVRVPLGEVE